MRALLPTFRSLTSSVRQASSKRIVSAVEDNNRIVTVKWDDGSSGRFPVIWLRDCSPDTSTYTFSPAMTARNLWMRDFDVKQNIKQMQLADDGSAINITWNGDVSSRYSSEWLQLRNLTCVKARKRRRKVYLFPEETWNRVKIENELKRFPFNECMTNDKVLHDFLQAVCLDGLAILKGGPGRGAVKQLGERIGLIDETHFGSVFEVSTKSDASNMAYASNGELPFHTDFPSLADPPQLQCLHMVERAEEGGRSLFVDGFHVAKQMQADYPELYDVLTKHSMEYIEEGYDTHEVADGRTRTLPFKMISRHRVIKTDYNGRVVQIQFGNAMRSWFYDCEPEDVQKIYDAMKVFTELCYDENNMVRLQLENGDTVLWANTRVLHTRDAFKNLPGKSRILEGSYFSWDVVKSRVRQIRTLLKLPEDQPSA